MRLLTCIAFLISALRSVTAFPVTFVGGTVTTPLGTVTGTLTIPGVYRFVFRYAVAARWRPAAAVTTLQSMSMLPPICPQELQDNSGNWTGQEDCLFVVLYVPTNFNGSSIVWFHGGSLLVGGANDPAIDGSALALATNSMVAVVQYRLGVLGFLPPPPNDNLGVRDAILALNLLHTILPSFGGSSQTVTVAGQSAGAMLIRAIVASPSASSLYSKVILHSDTLDYGFYKAETLTKLQGAFFLDSLKCSTTDTACQSAVPLDTIMNAQMDFDPSTVDPSTAGPIKFRPVHTSIITTTLTTSFPSTLKPLLLTTVKDEGAALIFGGINFVVPNDAYETVLQSVIPDFRADAVVNSSFYALTSDPDTVRIELKDIVTDLGWRCPDWTLAQAWSSRGGSVFTGTFLRAGLHSSNENIPFCSSSETNVCHTDDVPILFGTQANPSTAQSALIAEVQARWNNFIHSSTPNPPSFPTWAPTTSTSVNPFPLGGSGPIAAGACVGFWGTPVAPFDYQMWGL